MNEKNIRLVTAESVRAGHPDKLCDQVADAILDAHLRLDPNARVAVEVFATAGKVIVGGEITSKPWKRSTPSIGTASFTRTRPKVSRMNTSPSALKPSRRSAPPALIR